MRQYHVHVRDLVAVSAENGGVLDGRAVRAQEVVDAAHNGTIHSAVANLVAVAHEHAARLGAIVDDVAVSGGHKDALNWDGYGQHRVWIIQEAE